jgi:hypothetical protein
MALCNELSVQLMMRHKVKSIGYIKGPRLPFKRKWLRGPIIRVDLFFPLLIIPAASPVSATASFISGVDTASINYFLLYNRERAVRTR